MTMIADMSVTANYVRPATPASTMFVDAIAPRTLRSSPGWSYGYSTVRILDNYVDPVVNADVTGTFSGDYTETISATTNAHGIAIFTTTTQVQNPTFTFCVDDIVKDGLVYNSGDNIETCDSY